MREQKTPFSALYQGDRSGAGTKTGTGRMCCARNSERKEVADHSWLDYYAALAKEEEVYMLQDVPPSALV